MAFLTYKSESFHPLSSFVSPFGRRNKFSLRRCMTVTAHAQTAVTLLMGVRQVLNSPQ